MSRIYRRQFKVRHYELDSQGYLNNAVYLNYLQQAAIEASTEAGYSLARYDQLGAFWLARKTTAVYGRPAQYGDELEIQTWVSDFRRVQSTREYQLSCARSGEMVLQAQTNWAYLQVETLKPVRIPAAMATAFQPNGRYALQPARPDPAEEVIARPRRHSSRRRVQRYEIDSAGHVNNAIYLSWAEQACYDAWPDLADPATGWGEQTGLLFNLRRSELEYLKPALADDSLTLRGWVQAITPTHLNWLCEVYQAAATEASDEVPAETLLARIRLTYTITNPDGQTGQLPAALRQAIELAHR